MISVSNLCFRYEGAAQATLENLCFDVGAGEVFGLLGPSGAGKSTTQKILMGVLPKYTGSAALFGRPIAELGRGLYERIGVSFELPALYLRLSAVENLQLFASLYARPTRDPLDLLELVELDGAANQRVAEFSKGMKMRLNLCRALLHDPELLFLDEPTAGQDPSRARMMRRLIQSLKSRGKTVFLTTHNMAEAQEICDRVAFLSGGEIAAQGTPTELRRCFGKRVVEVTTSRDGGVVTRSFDLQDIGDNTDFVHLLQTQPIVSMHTQEASLDDVFIQATSSQSPTTRTRSEDSSWHVA